VAPPLVKGRALLRRRVSGIVFLLVIGMLVQLTVWLYQKRFTPVVKVALRTDHVGNQLSPHADVKVRGIVVGEVRAVHSGGDGATLDLALDPGKIDLLPRNVQAQLLPKTLFGEKEVVLVLPDAPSGERLRGGDVIGQDRSATALETEKAFNDTLPLLRTLQPQKLSQVLTSLSSALRGRGDRLGRNMAADAAYFRALNPALGTVGVDLQGLADLSDNLAQVSPDLLKSFDNFAASSRSLVSEKAALETFLKSTSDFAATARTFTSSNEARLKALAHDSVAPLKLYATYSDMYPCLLNRIAFSEIEGERDFGGAQPGLHITVEAVADHGGFAAGDEPQYKETRDPGCFGLGKKPIIPFPAYTNPQDGYRDSAPPEDPGKGPNGCCHSPTDTWQAQVVTSPSQTVVRRQVLPVAATPLDALLLAPLAGAG
jgi:virulence factor Mce-like protein